MARAHMCRSTALSGIEEAREHLLSDGYAHLRLGVDAPLREMDSAARQLMNLAEAEGGSYNGGGGVARKTIGDSSFLNASAGAPAELPVQFHNEMAYSANVPKHVAFAMVSQAGEGGTTLLADNVQVTKLLSAPLKSKLRDMGVQYVRNLNDESERDQPDYYLSWQGAFQTDVMEDAMNKGNTEVSVLRRQGDGPRLQQISWSPVFFDHPTFGTLYFSSILNRHGSWLDGHSVFGKMPHKDRPYHCVWGDGAEFSEQEIRELRAVHDESTLQVHLDKGDVIILDNLRVAHGRTSYQGDRLMGLLLGHMIDRMYKPPAVFRSFCDGL